MPRWVPVPWPAWCRALTRGGPDVEYQAMTAPGAFADMGGLRECWHPVAFGRDLTGRPIHVDLLGEPLVLWRGPGGGPRANSDLCVHRGTALSRGWTVVPAGP